MNGVLYLVSVGPGRIKQMTVASKEALKKSNIIIGYGLYFKWIKPLLTKQEIIDLPLTQEKQRAKLAIDRARRGETVSVISSGDIGIYGMATLIFETMSESDTFKVKVYPGVSAANATASLLGAPLSHDFACLSLSDLLCPWQWIEERAINLAKCDMVIALYNVQSKSRIDGIYKIINLLLKFKSKDTICGIVSNAYREEQSIYKCTLVELLDKTFDMYTTIIIGNKYTTLKQNFIYTPRGYNNFKINTTKNIPKNSIWLFAGTSDGNELANKLANLNYSVVISTATSYGITNAKLNCPNSVVLNNLLTQTERFDYIKDSAKYIIDATHPFAVNISQKLMDISHSLSIPYLRYERPTVTDYKKSLLVDSYGDAIAMAKTFGKNIFLAIGVKNLENFLKHTDVDRQNLNLFLRCLPFADSLEKALNLGILPENIIAMQGPFSTSLNMVLWKNWKINCVITKESGLKGGLSEKIEACENLKIPLIIIKRPNLAYINKYNSLAEIISAINQLEAAP